MNIKMISFLLKYRTTITTMTTTIMVGDAFILLLYIPKRIRTLIYLEIKDLIHSLPFQIITTMSMWPTLTLTRIMITQ